MDGMIWLGTNRGLSLYNEEGDSFVNYDKGSWIGHQNIWGIESDSKGNLWLISDQGII